MNANYQLTTTVNPKLATAQKALSYTASFWFLVSLIGMWFFVYYIAIFFGGTALQGDFESWNKVLFTKFREGGLGSNLFLVAHIFLAFIITAGGPLQFFPQLQRKAKAFHRWNGRLYIFTAIIIAITGLGLMATRDLLGGVIGRIGNFTNAGFILAFSILAWRTAVNRNFKAHRKWAIRTFLALSGVWFIRIAFGFWLLVNNGSLPGSNETFDGPFDQFLMLGHAMLPILFAELYFLAEEKRSIIGKWLMTGTLLLISLATVAGIFMATQVFWLPHV